MSSIMMTPTCSHVTWTSVRRYLENNGTKKSGSQEDNFNAFKGFFKAIFLTISHIYTTKNKNKSTHFPCFFYTWTQIHPKIAHQTQKIQNRPSSKL